MNTKNLKPFNLQTALNGEPVILRDGTKAYVRHHETGLPTAIGEILLGYLEGVGVWTWCADGASRSHEGGSEYDIIGMYPKTRTINGFEVPSPETEAPDLGDLFFVASCTFKKFFDMNSWSNGEFDNRMLKRGIVFLNVEDAIANAKAMLGIDPYKESKVRTEKEPEELPVYILRQGD